MDIKTSTKRWLLTFKYEMYHPELAEICESLKMHWAKTSDCIKYKPSYLVHVRNSRIYLKNTTLSGVSVCHVLYLIYSKVL